LDRPLLQVLTDNDRRGGQVFASDLHSALARRGRNVRSVALAPASSPAGLDFPVLGPSRRHPKTLRGLRSAMRGSSVVVAHGSTTLPMCALAGVALDVPFVYRQISEQLFWANSPGRRARTRLALGRAEHVVALWSGAAEVLRTHFGVHPGRITIVPNGVPAGRCPPADLEARAAARARFGLEDDRPTILSIGALVPEKGVDTIVRAMTHALLADCQLLIVGAGPERGRLEALASGLPDDRVRFHGPVSAGKEAMAAADLVVLTSRGGDSMPAVLIEAGMMGLPTVATPVEGIVDIVLDGRTGRLVPRDDPGSTAAGIADVLDHHDEFGKAAREHCLKQFEIDAVASRWHSVLDRVAGA
jgi:glycosyltransferase involved in cell wall biosynthesis